MHQRDLRKEQWQLRKAISKETKCQNFSHSGQITLLTTPVISISVAPYSVSIVLSNQSEIYTASKQCAFFSLCWGGISLAGKTDALSLLWIACS